MVRIITDSASDFEPQEFEALGVDYASLYVYFGDEEYKENVTLTKNQFYEMLQEKKMAPRTSLPSLHDIECLMKDAMEAGDDHLITSFHGILHQAFDIMQRRQRSARSHLLLLQHLIKLILGQSYIFFIFFVTEIHVQGSIVYN